MVALNKIPTYNLKVVLRETGIKPDTLRAWERRYGMPMPDRTSGGHRLYSEYDIETIKWLMARQDEGLRINRAVQLWRSLKEDGQDPIAAIPTQKTAKRLPAWEVYAGTTLDELRQNWIAACMAFDESAAENIIAQAFARYPLETVCLEVLRKGISEIGYLWYSGESTVQQEHFASALAIRRMDALIAAAPAPSRRERVLIGCPPQEDHIISPLMITLFLRYRGWDVVYLGANVPVYQLEATIRSTKPQLVILTAQQLFTAANLYDAALAVSETKVPLAYGGLIFNLLPDLRQRFPGHFLGESIEDVVQVIESILSSPPELPHLLPAPREFAEAAEHYRQKQPLLEAYLWEKFQRNGMTEHHLEIANDVLARDINASLRLGDMNFLRPEIDWLHALMENHQIPTRLLPKYLRLYQEAVERHLDERGQPILAWITQTVRDYTIFQD